jgi:transposase-like protein
MSETNGNGKRKRWSSAEKLRIVLAGLQTDTKVAELCRREGITANQYYQWRDRLLGSATAIFDRPSSGRVEEQRAEAELRRMKDVIAEITAENVELKKTF